MARSGALLTSALFSPTIGQWEPFHADEAPADGLFLMERDLARLLALEGDPSLGPSLFLYRWAEPTISLGYAQREERVLDETAVRGERVPVVRRPTGGRAILHVDEWTFAAAVAIDHPRLGGSLRESLAAVAGIVRAALAATGVRTDAVARAGALSSGEGAAAQACFDRALGHEITVDGRKLAGLAQRRLARALLTQGTILAGPGHERLADFLAGDAGSRRAGRESLAAGTVTALEVGGTAATFGCFAQALRRAWQGAEL
jgi:lipoate-protein ligase A